MLTGASHPAAWSAALAVLALVVAIGTHLLARRIGADRHLEALVPAVYATGVAVLAFEASYLWLFDTGGCSGRDQFACVTNSNQGVLGLYGIVLAIVGLWVAAIARQFDHRAARQELESLCASAVSAAVAEASHNLVHVAMCYDGQDFDGDPQVSLTCLEALLVQPVRREISPNIVDAAESIYRNVANLAEEVERWAEYAPGDRPPEPTLVTALAGNSVHLIVAPTVHTPSGLKW